MRSFLPIYFVIWVLAVIMTLLAPKFEYEFPQPWWAITLLGSFIFIVWGIYSKEKWFK